MVPARIALWVAGAAVAVGAIALLMTVRDGDAPAGPPQVAPADARKVDAPRAPANAGSARAGIAITELSDPADSPAAPATGSDAPADDDVAEAATLVESARTEATSGRYIEALSLFQRAYQLAPSPATLFDVGVMAHRTGRCREARRILLRVIAASPGDALTRKTQQLLDQIGRCD